MAKYIVNVIMSTCVAVEVEADNEEEAQDIAYEKANPSVADDWIYDIDRVFRDDDDDDD